MVNNMKMYGINPSRITRNSDAYNGWLIEGCIKLSGMLRTTGNDWSVVMLF